ncbi:mfs allantoate transporter [Lichtheimia corymbifera JMRC:FSU:9682]|uniref:Mfs allantoate transporter n=1 Tax=Lichtheimia corymbifera JMRC:FSU:9682 TaxID=1263082 RepID=A0A068RNR4_9FUNG|nr:mfs allantoate transporter [Lichtheimia corymbifera JMRC:FSU:9682]
MPEVEEKKEATVDFHEHIQSSASDDISSAERGGSAPSDAEKRVVRKINMAFVPMVCLIIFTQYMDKSVLNFSGIMGIYETGISHDQFAWLGSMFYVGFLVIQIPNQYFIQRVQISKYLGTILVIWGACLALTALARNFSQLAGLRFLLGFWEGTTYPAIFLLISTLYRRSEQVLWYGTVFQCNAATGIFGGLISYGIANMDGERGLRAWRWCNIIWGAFTFSLGFLFFFFLPDRPKSRWFRLTAEEEKIVEERTLDNAVVQNKKIKMSHVYEALREPRLYCYFFLSLLLNLQNGALTLFSSQITTSMGFSALNTVLLSIPHAFATIILLANVMFLSKRYNDICYVGMLSTSIVMIGAILLAAIPPSPGQLAGIYLGTSSPSYTMLQTSISSNVSGYTKKIFYTSCNLLAYCLGNFIGPLMMVEKEAPRYIGGLTGYAVADLICILLFAYLRWSMGRENKRREKLKEEGKIPPPPENRIDYDLTDKEDLNFVYRL